MGLEVRGLEVPLGGLDEGFEVRGRDWTKGNVGIIQVCVCVCARARVRVSVCVRACVRACLRACVCE